MSQAEKDGGSSRFLPLFSSFQSAGSPYPPQHRPQPTAAPPYSPVTSQMARSNAIPASNTGAPQNVNILPEPLAQQPAPAPQADQQIFPKGKPPVPFPSGNIHANPAQQNAAPQSQNLSGLQMPQPILSHSHPASVQGPDTSDTRPPTLHPRPDQGPLQAKPKPQEQTPAASTSLPEPPIPEPIDLSTNSDAIALRAAMSILKMQRRQAEQDIVTLSKQRDAALQDPKAFAEALRRDEVKMRDMAGTGGLGGFDDSEDDEDAQDDGTEIDDDDYMSTSPASPMTPSTPLHPLGPIPTPQNVVRTPKINWAKYHIMSKPLEKMHRSETQNPTEGTPRTDQDLKQEISRMQGLGRQGEAVLTAAYDPWRDELAPKGERPVGLNMNPLKTKGSNSAADTKTGRRRKPGKKAK